MKSRQSVTSSDEKQKLNGQRLCATFYIVEKCDVLSEDTSTLASSVQEVPVIFEYKKLA